MTSLEPPASSDPFAILTTPGGGRRVRLSGADAVADDGTRFAVENGIVRMLGRVDSQLAAELAAQEEAKEIYLDEQFIAVHHEYELIRLLVGGLLANTSGPILDAGCGVGTLGRLYPDLGLYGVDVSFPLLAHVRAGYRLLVEANAEALPFEDAAFDVVVAIGVLHHVINPGRAIAEFTRVLRPTGFLIAIDPRKLWAIELVKKLLRRSDAAFAETHKAFSLREYEQLIGDGRALTIDHLQAIGLVAPLVVGAFEAFRGMSRRLPARWSDAMLKGLLGIDRALARLPGIERAGLNLSVQARRA